MTKEELGQRLKEIRESKGITCTDVARDLKFGSGARISACEHGLIDTRLDNILQHLKYLGSQFVVTDGAIHNVISNYFDFVNWVNSTMNQLQVSRDVLATRSGIPQSTLKTILSYRHRVRVSSALAIIQALNFTCTLPCASDDYVVRPGVQTLSNELTLLNFADIICSLDVDITTKSNARPGLTPIGNKHLESGTGRITLPYAILYLEYLQHIMILQYNGIQLAINSYNDFLVWAKAARQSLGLSAAQACWKMGVSNSLVSNFESGRTTLTLAAFLKVIAAYGATLSIIKK